MSTQLAHLGKKEKKKKNLINILVSSHQRGDRKIDWEYFNPKT